MTSSLKPHAGIENSSKMKDLRHYTANVTTFEEMTFVLNNSSMHLMCSWCNNHENIKCIKFINFTWLNNSNIVKDNHFLHVSFSLQGQLTGIYSVINMVGTCCSMS